MENEPPVVHHIEMCVKNMNDTISILHKFGFTVFGKRDTKVCEQFALKLGSGIIFVVNQRKGDTSPVCDEEKNNLYSKGTSPSENSFPCFCCCDNKKSHTIDSVFNVCLTVKNVERLTKRICSVEGGFLLDPPKKIEDEHGTIFTSVIGNAFAGNVKHTLLNKTLYRGFFLPGWTEVNTNVNSPLQDIMTHIDHITLAAYRANSNKLIHFYESAFGMTRLRISKDENLTEGTVIGDGVGIRLKALEYWRCAETGLIYPPNNKESRTPSVMFVVVESLPGQTDCNIEQFLRHHEQQGIEHVALSTNKIQKAITLMNNKGCDFRKPPRAYYSQLMDKMQGISENIFDLESLGILLDIEEDGLGSTSDYPKFLMQIFHKPIFHPMKTFFIEIIQRCNNARGLGAGNVLALVRSIREEEKKKKAESKKQELNDETQTSRVC